MTAYGCHNSARSPGYYVMVREYLSDRTYRMKQEYIADCMSAECRYDFRATDRQCEGCGK